MVDPFTVLCAILILKTSSALSHLWFLTCVYFPPFLCKGSWHLAYKEHNIASGG